MSMIRSKFTRLDMCQDLSQSVRLVEDDTKLHVKKYREQKCIKLRENSKNYQLQTSAICETSVQVDHPINFLDSDIYSDVNNGQYIVIIRP